MPANWILQGRLVVTGLIECVTGLHIGGSQEGVDIGGLDAPVVRVQWLPAALLPTDDTAGNDAKDYADVPYIPGSSLRGKMRSLLEWYEGKVSTQGPAGAHECTDPDSAVKCVICRVFGRSATEGKGWERRGPTRLRVEDAYPTPEALEQLARYYEEGIYTEVKWENYLNRLTSMATPRQIERVPAGATFAMRLVYDVMGAEENGQPIEPSDWELFDRGVLTALCLLEDSALGGHGSRGYGRIRLRGLKLEWRPKEYYLGKAQPDALEADELTAFVEKARRFVQEKAKGGEGE